MRIRDLHRVFDTEVLMAKTISSNNTWCFHRFRLYTANSITFAEARMADGTVIDRQLFSTPGYVWGGGFEASFYFDLSFNTANDPIEIWLINIPTGATFQQLYAVGAHAGLAVRYSEDANITGMSNAQLTYLNMGLLKFTNGFSVSIVYLENQGLTKIDGGQEFRGKTLDISGNALPAADIDDCIIGADLSGGSSGYMDWSGGTNEVPTIASRPAYDRLVTKSWNLLGTAPPTT